MMNRATLSRRAPRRYRKTLAAMAASTVLAVFNPTAAAAGAKPLTPTTELAPAMAFAPTTAFVQAGMA